MSTLQQRFSYTPNRAFALADSLLTPVYLCWPLLVLCLVAQISAKPKYSPYAVFAVQ
jgi:hypothetical protein